MGTKAASNCVRLNVKIIMPLLLKQKYYQSVDRQLGKISKSMVFFETNYLYDCNYIMIIIDKYNHKEG